ncbi:MAG: DinB family protein [Dehalococcoidia bacterium]|nr:DinB family protein [Dehalococcoidia bacterium]
MSTTVSEVIAELDAHRVRFEQFCRSLSEEQLNRDVPQSTWKVRDFIAHLATIDGPVGEMFRTVHAGQDPGIRDSDGGRFDVDNWNDRRVLERRERTVEELLAEAATSRAELRQHLAALTDEDCARTMKFGGDSRRPPAEFPLGQYLRGWCKHDPMHAVDMSRAIPEAITPEVAEWFADPVVQGYQRQMNPS